MEQITVISQPSNRTITLTTVPPLVRKDLKFAACPYYLMQCAQLSMFATQVGKNKNLFNKIYDYLLSPYEERFFNIKAKNVLFVDYTINDNGYLFCRLPSVAADAILGKINIGQLNKNE